MIYVTVGTMFLDFPRLIRKMDDIAHDTGEKVVCQIGMGQTIPKHCEHFRFRSRDEILALQREARVVVAHAGIGCVMEALQCERPLVVVPRLKRHNEHMDDHQLDLAKAVERRGWGRMVIHVDELDAILADPPAPKTHYAPAREPLIAAIKANIGLVAQRK